MRIKAPGFRLGCAIEVDFSPDGQLLATVGRNTVLWSVTNRHRLRSTRLLRHPSATTFSPDGAQLLVKSTSGDLHLCEAATGDPLWHYRSSGHDEGPGALFAAPQIIADASWNGSLVLRDLASSSVTTLWREENSMIGTLTRARDRWAFTSRRKHSHPRFADRASAGCIVVSDALLQGQFRTVDRAWDGLSSIALSPIGDAVAVRYGARESALDVIRISTGERLASSPCSTGGTGDDLAWSPDNRAIVLVEKGGFSFRDVSTLREIGWLPSQYPSHVKFAPDGSLIALGDWSAGIVVAWPSLLDGLSPREITALGPSAS